MNWITNSPPYGYGGRSADMTVFPVRIIMSPTCSSRFLVGRNARSAAARTTLSSSLLGRAAGGADCDWEAYAIRVTGANRQPLRAAPGRLAPVVHSARFGEESGRASEDRPANSRPARCGGDRDLRLRQQDA